MQPLAILFGAAFTVLVSISFGALLLQDSCQDPAIRFVTGAGLLSLLVFTLCSIGWAYPPVFLALGALAMVLGLRLKRRWPGSSRLLLLFLPFFALYFFNSMAPEISYDGSRYHLGLLGRYLREHGFHSVTDNFYASLSQGVEMLYLFAYAFGRHSAAAMVHFAFLLALTWQIYSYGRRVGFPIAGTCAALLVFASPVVGVDGSSAYVDVAVAAIAFTLFQLLQFPLTRRLLVVIGLLAGFAYAAKYTAALAIPYAIGVVFWKTRSARQSAIVAACAAILVVPWMTKNWLWVHNPVAPFFNRYFLNQYVTTLFESEYLHSLAHVASPAELPFQLTVYGSLSGLLGPVFLLAPLALLSLRRSEGRQLLLAAAVFGLPFFANLTTRFLIPPLPFLALAMMLSLAAVPKLAVAIAVLHAVISWPPVVRRYSHSDAWRLVKIPYREALRIKPEEGYLESNLPFYGATRMVERLTRPGSTIFTLTPMPEAYTTRHIRVAYQSAGNIMSRNTFWIGFVPEHMPTWRLRFNFPRQPVRSLKVVQTATGKDVWSMHELRVFDGNRELSRDSWRTNAEGILDGRPTSFWMSGDTLHPGEFVQVDLPAPMMADSVLIEAAPDQPGIQLRLDGLASAPIPDIAVLPDLRRAAAEELKRQGNDYLLLFDGEFGADDVQRNAAAWGVRPIGEYKGARLYQLP